MRAPAGLLIEPDHRAPSGARSHVRVDVSVPPPLAAAVMTLLVVPRMIRVVEFAADSWQLASGTRCVSAVKVSVRGEAAVDRNSCCAAGSLVPVACVVAIDHRVGAIGIDIVPVGEPRRPRAESVNAL